MSRSLTYYADSKPTFQEWLTIRDKMTSRELYDMFQATSMRYGEYDRAMELLRREYREEMEYRDALLASNPFAT